MDERDLTPVGAVEVADLLRVRRGTVDQWQQRGLLPPPDWTVGGRPAWRRQAIVDWANRTGRPTALETAVKRILDQLDTPTVALTGEMCAAIVDAADIAKSSPYRALAHLSQELESERHRLAGLGRQRELEYVERMQVEVRTEMSGWHAFSE